MGAYPAVRGADLFRNNDDELFQNVAENYRRGGVYRRGGSLRFAYAYSFAVFPADNRNGGDVFHNTALEQLVRRNDLQHSTGVLSVANVPATVFEGTCRFGHRREIFGNKRFFSRRGEHIYNNVAHSGFLPVDTKIFY